MPKVMFEGKSLEVAQGTTLRNALKQAGLTPHNGQSRWLNCKGLGSCGTCAVWIEGELHEKTAMERWRLNFPPHTSESGLRLACQVRVEHNLVVKKYEGFWGQHSKK